MKSKIATFFVVLFFIAGLGVFNYPVISTLYNQLHEGTVMASYDETVARMEQEELDALYKQAQDYNRKIAEEGPTVQDAFEQGETVEDELYNQTLNMEGSGVMGSIEIPKIHVFLPIYHGTSSDVLEVGVGHLQGSSLPVGGDTTHSILTGHRGLPSAELFTNLDQLEEGDIFYIHILRKTLAYKIYNIETILPEEVENLVIEEGKDLITLVTCTPYGINSHRLLLHAERTVYEEPEKEINTAEARSQNLWEWLLEQKSFLISAAVLALLLLYLILSFIRNIIKKGKTEK